MMVSALMARADGTPDALTFITGGDLGSVAILSTSAANPDTVFYGVNLDDYEPAYAYFNRHNPGGQKWSVCPDLEQEILRPYNIVRATENDAATMTVQFQGVTRMHTSPYTASITIKFFQSGSDVTAYIVRAASLKPLDIELGLDLDAMVDGGNPRAMSRPLTGDGKYNISLIAMRKPAATVAYAVHDTTIVHDTLYFDVPYAVQDTTVVTDTLWLTLHDTVWMTDTVYIHDTIYVPQEGVTCAEPTLIRLYQRDGQIVVEGDVAGEVALFDAVGRKLETRRGKGNTLLLDVPASGTYLVKVGNHPARRIVAVK